MRSQFVSAYFFFFFFFPTTRTSDLFSVQHLPEWCPGAGFKKFARECRKLTRELRDKPYAFVQKQMVDDSASSPKIMFLMNIKVKGIAPHSMVSEMLEHNEEEAVIKSVAGTTYAGWFDCAYLLGITRT